MRSISYYGVGVVLVAAVGLMAGCAGARQAAVSEEAVQQKKVEQPPARIIEETPEEVQEKVKPAVEKKEAKKETRKDTAVVETSMGTIKFKFYSADAPATVENFKKLVGKKFYDGLIFHRVIKGFMIQGGCPKGDGTGDPGYKIKAEFNKQKHLPGTVAMARAQHPDSAGSQFYICLEPSPFLDGKYTVFGQVFEGMDVVKKIGLTPTAPGDRPLTDVVMKRVYLE